MEGITAALIILGVLYLIIEANSMVVPQTEKVVDMKLGELANDMLTTLDWNSASSWSTAPSLQSYVEGWNGHAVTYASNVPDPSLATLNSNLTAMLLQDNSYRQGDVHYNLEFVFTDKNLVKHDDMVLLNGEPGDNSMVATRIVTLNGDDPKLSTWWKSHNQTPQVVQVRLTCWHV